MWKVYVGNLDSRVKERELADEFRVYGNVRSVWVARNPPGYAFVEFDARRDAEDAVSRLDGRHGWRVEMSRKSVGSGHSRSSHGSESRCYECGGVGHFARECRSRLSRHSRRRSLSPPSRTDSNRHGLTRSGRGSSRSPRRDRENTYRERSSPRRKRERSRSLESDKSDSRGHRGKGRRHETSQHEEPSSSREELDKPPQDGALVSEQEGESPQNGDSECRGVNSQEGSEASKSPLSERSEDVGDIQKEEYMNSGSPQGEQSDIEGSRCPDVREDSRSPLPENINSFEDGESPLTNGNAGRSPEEENNGYRVDSSPAEEIAEGHRSGESE